MASMPVTRNILWEHKHGGLVGGLGVEADAEGGIVDRYSNDDRVKLTSYVLFQQAAIRRGFLRKVFSLVAMQVAFTFAVVAGFLFIPGVKSYVQDAFGLFLASTIILIVVASMMVCCDELRRLHPFNLIALGLFTLSISFFLGCFSCYLDTLSVIFCMGIVLAFTVILVGVFLQTAVEITGKVMAWLSVVVLMLVFGGIQLLWADMIIPGVYACAFSAFFAGFMIYDISAIVGGEHLKYALMPDEYCFAALNLYIDIVTMIIILLVWLGGSGGSTSSNDDR